MISVVVRVCAILIEFWFVGAGPTPPSAFEFFIFYLTRMSVEEIDDANYVWQYFAITNHTDPKKSWGKNAICAFCDKRFIGCSTSRAAAHNISRDKVDIGTTLVSQALSAGRVSPM